MDDHNYFESAADKFFANFWQKAALWFMGFMLMALLAVSPQKKEEAKKEEVKSAGDMMIEIHWPDKIDIDIDLWVKSPDDDKPVGYTNRAGKTFNLLRDDLGKHNDSTDRNFEMVYARGLPAGEYIINIHFFRRGESESLVPEVPVELVVSTKPTSAEKVAGGMKQIITRKAVLRLVEEEITVVRFVIREDGELDPESVNDLEQGLRTWRPQTP